MYLVGPGNPRNFFRSRDNSHEVIRFLRSADLHRACGLAVLVLALSGCSPQPSPLATELARCSAINFLPQRAACIDNAYGARSAPPTKGAPSFTVPNSAPSMTAPNSAPPVPDVEPKATGGPTPLTPGTSVK